MRGLLAALKDMWGLALFCVGVRLALAGQRAMSEETHRAIGRKAGQFLKEETRQWAREWAEEEA